MLIVMMKIMVRLRIYTSTSYDFNVAGKFCNRTFRGFNFVIPPQ